MNDVFVLIKEADNGYDTYTEVIRVFFGEGDAIKFKDNLPKTDDIWVDYRIVKSTLVKGVENE